MPRLPIGDIGPCEVTWDYGDTNLVITPYLGKVSLRMADVVTDVHIDGQGVAPIESFFEGATLELEVPMARSTLSQLANTIGYRDLGTPASNQLTLHNVAGIEMMTYAKAIVIKPLCNGVPDANPNHWTIIYKCHPYRDFELCWDRNGQRVHMVKFKVFPNQDSGYEGEYYQEGLIGWHEEFYDDFCEETLEADWITHGLSVDKTITIDPDICYLTIEIANNADAVWYCEVRNIAPKMYRDLGDIAPCRIITKLRQIPPDPGATCPDDIMAGIFIGTDPEGLGNVASHLAYLWGRYKCAGEGADALRLIRNCGAYATVVGCGIGCLPKWLKIEIDADEDMRFYYSDTGLDDDWDQHPEVIGGEYVPTLKVGLFAKNGINDPVTGGTTNLAAQFEYFLIESYG